MKTPTYKVAIVDFRKEEAAKCLVSDLCRQTLRPSEVVVINNDPSVDPETYFQGYRVTAEGVELTLLHPGVNLGYTVGCNVADYGNSDYLLLANPDIRIPERTLMERLLSLAEALPACGAVGVSQLNPDGTFEIVARRFPTALAVLAKRVPLLRPFLRRHESRYLDAYDCKHAAQGQSIEVDWLQSSFLLVPRSAWVRAGRFDSKYFVFMADVDFGMRVASAHLKCWFVPSLCVQADGKRASAGGILSIMTSRALRIHLSDAAKYVWSQLSH